MTMTTPVWFHLCARHSHSPITICHLAILCLCDVPSSDLRITHLPFTCQLCLLLFSPHPISPRWTVSVLRRLTWYLRIQPIPLILFNFNCNSYECQCCRWRYLSRVTRRSDGTLSSSFGAYLILGCGAPQISNHAPHLGHNQTPIARMTAGTLGQSHQNVN